MEFRRVLFRSGGLGIGAHRTDLENVIGLAEQADAGLAIEDRPAAIEHHRDPRDDDQRKADDQHDQTGEDVEQALADLRNPLPRRKTVRKDEAARVRRRPVDAPRSANTEERTDGKTWVST